MTAAEHVQRFLAAVRRRVGRPLTSQERAYAVAALCGYHGLLASGMDPGAVAALASQEGSTTAVH